ncbi:PTS sugar transporter subunit IIA [bacterium]|nr:PTS sugar transporter subunit IIA [bacterium]
MQNQLLLGYFREHLFVADIDADTTAGVLGQLVEPLLKNSLIKNKTIILETLQKREALGSTSIGRNIAVPHCRTLAVSEVIIVVGISPGGVDFNAPDGEPVNLFFLIVAPPQDTHNHYLPILGKIVEIVRNDDIRASLLQCGTYGEFIETLEEGLR